MRSLGAIALGDQVGMAEALFWGCALSQRHGHHGQGVRQLHLRLRRFDRALLPRQRNLLERAGRETDQGGTEVDVAAVGVV